jgi:hypothetical protein
VFHKRVLRRIIGPKREEVKGGWRRLHNEELHNFLLYPFILYVPHIVFGDLITL